MAFVLAGNSLNNPIFLLAGQSINLFTAPGIRFTDTDPANLVETVNISYNNYGYPPISAPAGIFADPANGVATTPASPYTTGYSFTEKGLIPGSSTFATQVLDRLTYTAPVPSSGSGLIAVNAGVSGTFQAISTSGQTITDSHNNQWQLVADAANPALSYQIALNGKTIGFTQQVTELADVDDVIWQDTPYGWYSLGVSSSGAAVALGGPTATSPLPTSSYTPVYIRVVTVPTISGTVGNEPVASGQTIAPFATVNIVDDNNFSQYSRTETFTTVATDAATITITEGGSPTDADGLLTGVGLSKTGVGSYSIAPLAAAALQSALRGLKFVALAPAGKTRNPVFTTTVTDFQTDKHVYANYSSGPAATASETNIESLTNTDTTTSLVIEGPTGNSVAPTIVGTLGSQQVSNSAITPFAYASLSDGNLNALDTITITMHNSAGGVSDADGTLAGDGLAKTGSGVYTLAAGSPAAITAELNMLAFTPTSLASGIASETTTFTLVATDTSVNMSSTADSKTTVVNSQTPTLPSGEYIIVDNNAGAFYIADTVAGNTQVVSAQQVKLPNGAIAVLDHTGNAEDVSRLYNATFARFSDVAGLEYWASALDHGSLSLIDVADAFIASPEFITDYGSLPDASYVNQLYHNVLGRAADPAGAQAWDHAIASGMGRGAVLIGFAESQENKAATISIAGDANNSEAYRLYQAALNRTPDTAGLDYWSRLLAGGASSTQAAQGFIGSAEFQQEYGTLSINDFVSTMYQNVLHRAADPAGAQFWTSAIQHGSSKASVLVGFPIAWKIGCKRLAQRTPTGSWYPHSSQEKWEGAVRFGLNASAVTVKPSDNHP